MLDVVHWKALAGWPNFLCSDGRWLTELVERWVVPVCGDGAHYGNWIAREPEVVCGVAVWAMEMEISDGHAVGSRTLRLAADMP